MTREEQLAARDAVMEKFGLEWFACPACGGAGFNFAQRDGASPMADWVKPKCASCEDGRVAMKTADIKTFSSTVRFIPFGCDVIKWSAGFVELGNGARYYIANGRTPPMMGQTLVYFDGSQELLVSTKERSGVLLCIGMPAEGDMSQCAFIIPTLAQT